MKKNIIIGLVLFMGMMYPQVSNPCEEERYLELKKKSLDDMSEREYEYFKQKDKECSEYSLKQGKQEKRSHQKTNNSSNLDLLGFNVIGGITYSKVAGDDAMDDVDNLMGFRFGLEQALSNGFIVGVTYSQRGFSASESEPYGNAPYSIDIKWKINYITGYALFRMPLNPNAELLAGGEVGAFWNGEVKSKSCYDGYCESDTEDIDDDDWRNLDNNMFDFGLVLGGRFSINEQVSLVGTYYVGFADMNDDAEVNNRSFQISISFRFQD